jgi:hypothetical protein
MSGYTMADDAPYAVVSIPSLSITSAVDVTSGSDVVRFSMGAMEIGNFSSPQWNMTMPIYSVHDDQRGSENLISRFPGLMQAGLRLIKEYMDAPAEVFGLPGEELPRVASTSLLVNGRDEASPVQRWRHWLACQALQHYGELDRLDWWHPTDETKRRMPELAERFAHHMEYAV